MDSQSRSGSRQRDPPLVGTGARHDRLFEPSADATRAARNIYVHTGNSGQGMTHGVVGSLMHCAA